MLFSYKSIILACPDSRSRDLQDDRIGADADQVKVSSTTSGNDSGPIDFSD